MKTKFTGYVLAGGKSSRMGTDKAFLEFGGETFLARAAKSLAPAGKTKIVVNEDQQVKFERHFPSSEFVFDIHTERGALGGIHAALSNCESEFAVILAVDLPFVSVATIETLIKIALSGEGFAAIVPRQSDGRFQPLCAVYPVAASLPAAEKLLVENASVSMRDFLRMIPVRFVEPSEFTSGGEDLFFNVNQPGDLKKLGSAI